VVFTAEKSNYELPLVAAARERDREARDRLRRGKPYRPSPEALLEQRAWRRAAQPPFKQIIHDNEPMAVQISVVQAFPAYENTVVQARSRPVLFPRVAVARRYLESL
jgi:hypothetical protein